MKKYLLSISILVVLILGSSIFIPYIFKDQIIEEIKKEANTYLKLDLDFSPKIGINIFKSFPDLNLTLNEVELVYPESDFSKDTLLTMEKLEVSFDLMRFYKDQQYIFNSIELTKPELYLESKDSMENWDILNEVSESDENNLTFHLSHFEITNGSFAYKDESNFFSISGIDHTSTGVYNSEIYEMKSESHADNVYSSSAGITYINHWELNQSGDITVDLGKSLYSFKKNALRVNGLPVSLDGNVQVESENIKFDAKASSISSNLQSFLTLIPSVYTSEYENIEAKGKGKLSFSFIGDYNDVSFPAFDLKLSVNEGYFKYPDLPIPAEKINTELHIFSETGDVTQTVIDIPKLQFKIENDPFDAKINIKDIYENAYINCDAHGRINLSNIKKILPLKETTLEGVVAADLDIVGRVNDIASTSVERFSADGSIYTDGLKYQTEGMSDVLEVNEALIEFTNNSLEIPRLDARIGKNDFDLSGKLHNLFPYLFGDKTLTGNIILTSQKLNLNDFITESTSDSSVSISPIVIPENIDLAFSTQINELKYDDLLFNNLAGHCHTKDHAIDFEDISTEVFGGNVTLTGKYLFDILKPDARFDISYSNIRMVDLLSNFKIFKSFVPIASDLQGNTSAKLSFSSILNEDMSPDLSVVSLLGSLNVENIESANIDLLKQIDQKLGTTHFSTEAIQDLLLNFEIEDGKLNVKPFMVFLDSSKLSLGGFSKLDGSISYNGILSVPSSYIKKETSIVQNLIEGTSFSKLSIDTSDFLDLAISVGGSFQNPKVSLNLKEIKNNVQHKVEAVIVSEVSKKKEEAKKAADEEIERIKEETRLKAEEAKAKLEEELLLKKKEAEEKLRIEAERQKQKAKEEALKKLKGLFDK